MRDYRRETAWDQLQARDHQRRMSPNQTAWFVVGALEAFAWLCFTGYMVWRVAVFGGAM